MSVRCAIAIACGLSGVPAAAWALPFEWLTGDEVSSSNAFSVTADGSVAVGRCTTDSAWGACRMEGGAATILPDLPPNPPIASDANAVSADGSVVVGRGLIGPGDWEGAVWSSGGVTGTGSLPNPPWPDTEATVVSADGQIVAGRSREASGGQAGFRWEAGVLQRLVPAAAPVQIGWPQGISADGSVIVGFGTIGFGKSRAVRWEGGVAQDLGVLPTPSGQGGSSAYDVTDDGRVVVGSSAGMSPHHPDPGLVAFRWEAGVMTSLGDLPGGLAYGVARAVSADGRIVVGTSNGRNGYVGFVWDAENGMRDLEQLLLDEYAVAPFDGRESLRYPDDVSADGLVIVGSKVFPDTHARAWRVRLSALCSNGLDDDGDGAGDYPADPGCASAGDWSERGPGNGCDDGDDADADGYADHPADAGCASLSDADERDATLECDDGVDGDGDGAVDVPADPGCSDPADPSERSPELACDNGTDDDGDARVDFPADPGCASPAASTETPACDDGIDNDGDGAVDTGDPGCAARSDPSERSDDHPCDNGLDDDGDGAADYPADASCAGPDGVETTYCSNGYDDDGDALVDFPADPGCASAASDYEDPECSNGWDDDWDGDVDFPADPGCASPSAEREGPECDDGYDDDGDGTLDWDGGQPGGVPDPGCKGSPTRISESAGCGLGFEIAPLLLALRFARRSRRTGR